MSLPSPGTPGARTPRPVTAAAEWDLLTDDVHWSPETYEVLGRDPRLGPLTLDRFPGQLLLQDRPTIRRVLTEALVHGRALAGVVHVRGTDGRVGRIDCLGEPVLDQDGRVTALRMLMRTA